MGRLYVLCSNKLDPMYAAVQGGHAIAEFLIEQQEGLENHNRSISRDDQWYNDTVVYLSADVEDWYEYLSNFKHLWYYYTTWEEPDCGNKLTAIALHIPGDIIDYKTKKLENYDNCLAYGNQIPKHRELLKKLKSEKLLGFHSLDEELDGFIENPRE